MRNLEKIEIKNMNHLGPKNVIDLNELFDKVTRENIYAVFLNKVSGGNNNEEIIDTAAVFLEAYVECEQNSRWSRKEREKYECYLDVIRCIRSQVETAYEAGKLKEKLQ